MYGHRNLKLKNNSLHVSDGFSVHHQEHKIAHRASDQYCYLLLAAGSSNGLRVQCCAPDDGRKTRLKHVERLTEIHRETLDLVGCEKVNSVPLQAWSGPEGSRKLKFPPRFRDNGTGWW